MGLKLKGNWFYEELSPSATLSLKVRRILFEGRSKYQRIQVLDTYAFGRTLVLDGVFQTTEKDEFVYHEMLTHPLLLSLPATPKKVLIVGGGDAGVAREVLKYPVEKVYLVEIDNKVIDVTKKYFERVCGESFEDPRLEVHVQDGAEFVETTEEEFDAVIVDSSDPVGSNKPLFSKAFYSNVKNVLKPEGLTARQTGSSFLQPRELPYVYRTLKSIFPIARAYVAATPTYWGGLFTYVCASAKTDPAKVKVEKIKARFNKLKLKTRCYVPELHSAAFSLPAYIAERIKG